MRKNKQQRRYLNIALLINTIIVIPLILRKPPIKDWIIVYLFNAITNGIIDNFLSSYKIVKYPVRLFPKIFKTHLLFNYFLYPSFTVFYNQITYKDKALKAFLKLILVTIPPFLIEVLAVKKTEYIVWSKNWKWYHTFFSIILKSSFTRVLIVIIRRLSI
ncbi:CBO0543 family protein [Bacillus sp. Au-Bac7]|uniref:CBO0543 family protein n=1 Tax=Bacillus sp. Au-Bac7 TaxID=2906458 RepID=UPI001E601587|nr:CBO0543 family protein [Bacillus sp. Au-Bac7]MCE4051704.1 hypothetical protein [Bacillus sp. Au-Bac7]